MNDLSNFGMKFASKNSSEVEQVEKNIKSKMNFWDPADLLELKKINKNCSDLNSKFEKLKKDPSRIKRNKLIFLTIGIFFIFVDIGLGIFSGEMQLPIFFSIFGVIPLFIYISRIKSMSVDLIKMQIAEQSGWVYNPEPDSSRWRILRSKFPNIFNKGNSGQYVEDQFWGSVNYKKKGYPFHTGLFTYTVRHDKSSTTYHTNYFAVKLNSKQKSSFYLYPENAFSKFVNLFSRKEINTESIEFNKTFAFSYKGKKDEHAMNIVKALSPAVQQKLINLKKNKGTLEILFQDDVFLVLFKGKLLHHLKTNFSKSLKINKSDVKQITDELKEVLDISTEMLHYIK